MQWIGMFFAALTLASAPSGRAAVLATTSGDYNGDGLVDEAWLEADSQRFRVVVRLAGRWEKPEFVVDEGAAKDAANLYLRKAAPGSYQGVCFEDDESKCPGPVSVTHDAIEYGAEEASSSVIYWTGKDFGQVWTSD